MDIEKQNALKESDSQYSNIICKCEQITEGEILDVMSRLPYPTTIDGIKRRVRAGMGSFARESL